MLSTMSPSESNKYVGKFCGQFCGHTLRSSNADVFNVVVEQLKSVGVVGALHERCVEEAEVQGTRQILALEPNLQLRSFASRLDWNH